MSASRITGLTDFGPDDYTDGLEVLLESYARDADLTPLGRKMSRGMLRGALTSRLLSEAAWQAHPEHAAVPIERPIFVTGLPRTGTTALHRLLTADPAHQGLEMWLIEVPQPRPPRDTWAADPVFQQLQAAFEQHHVAHPEFMGVHYMAADQVEECWQLLRQSMRSDLLRVPGPPARLLGLAARPGLDRGLPPAPAQPAAHRAERRGPPLGAEEPQPPVRAGRAAGGVPGRAGHPDAPRPADRHRLGVQPGRARHRRLVGHVPRRGARPGPARPVGPRPGVLHRGPGPLRPGPVLRRAVRDVHR